MARRQIEMVWRCSSCGHQNLGRHALCQRCGNPKDASEVYEMPGATSAAPSVTDPALLRMAEAGANWQCSFCGSHQRRYDGACANCGAAQADGRAAQANGRAAGSDVGPLGLAGALPTQPKDSRRSLGLLAFALLGLFMTCSCCWVTGLVGSGGVPARVDTTTQKTRFIAEVIGREWSRELAIDRYQRAAHEGFADAIPADAVEREALGQRHHHDEQVPDGFTTEHYTERVQSGTETEFYTERVQCGQTCVPRPQQCQEVCTPNGNGFATCEDHCTGGGEDCSPRYCDEQRTRQVPRYVDEPRTRQVPRFRSEPRLAEWYRYVVWEWLPDRAARTHGSEGEAPRWPTEDELRTTRELGEGERERERRSETYVVRLRVPTRELVLRPATEAEFAAHPLGARYHVLLAPDGSFRVEGPARDAH
ncbi:MAG: hypothetical protein H6725_12155 [Sandaracinaceae bacterium]|nr:hypothetical protein [Sandaracinaceae bacterium]